MMPLNTKYNGWSNYPTWRVALEFFDGYLSDISQGGHTEGEARDMVQSDNLKDFVVDLLSHESSDESTVLSYAMAFLEDVDWGEIEANLMQEVYEYDWDE